MWVDAGEVDRSGSCHRVCVGWELTCGHRVSLIDLAGDGVLQQVRPRAVQDSRLAHRKRGGMARRIDAIACRLDAIHLDVFVADERMEHPNRV